MAELLSATGVHVALPDRSRVSLLGRSPLIEILKGVDVTLASGEALGVVGESGSGKSTLGRALQGDPGLPGQRVPLGALAGVCLGREVMARESPSELVGPDALEVPGGGEVARLAIRPREGVVGDLADERLHEGVLAPLRRARVRGDREDLAADQRP